MSTVHGRDRRSTAAGAGVAIVLLATLGIAIVTAQIVLWFVSVLTVGLAVVTFWLFYRLVVAIETIAEKL